MPWWGVVLCVVGALALGVVIGGAIILLRADPFKNWL